MSIEGSDGRSNWETSYVDSNMSVYCASEWEGEKESNIPAIWAIRATEAPPPGGKTFPTWISSTISYLAPARSTAALKTATNNSSGQVSFNPPFLARVKGVRTAEQMTTSESHLVRAAARPTLDPTWPANCETRSNALYTVSGGMMEIRLAVEPLNSLPTNKKKTKEDAFNDEDCWTYDIV